MAECTDGERALLDQIKDCDFFYVGWDGGQQMIRWMQGYGYDVPTGISVRYGDGPDGRTIRQVKLDLGLNARDFKAAVARGREEDEAEERLSSSTAHARPDGTPCPYIGVAGEVCNKCGTVPEQGPTSTADSEGRP